MSYLNRAVFSFAILLLAGCGQSPEQFVLVTNPVADKLECLPQPTPHGGGHAIRAEGSHVAVSRDVDEILPPGQSGHFPSAAACPLTNPTCAAPGNAPDSYGPNIDDQRLPYWRSEFRAGDFMDISSATPDTVLTLTTPVTDNVRIYRDEGGIPVVHADTAYGVWYGAGYGLAQDRLFLIDAAIRLARGTSGESQGEGALAADVQTRVLTYSEAEYQTILNGLSDRARTALAGHVAGINQRIADVLAASPVRASNPLMPQEFVALNHDPTPLIETDVLALGVLMTRFVASAGGDEMANVIALQQLEQQHGKELGRQIFKDILWVDDKLGDVTIPDREFTNISTPLALRDEVFEAAADFAVQLPPELAVGPGTGDFSPAELRSFTLAGTWRDFVNDLAWTMNDVPLIGSALQSLTGADVWDRADWPVVPEHYATLMERWKDIPDHVSASYMMVASPDITDDGSTLLVNGPQLGYSYPSLLVEVEVHGGGYDARGATVAGLPVVGIGYGERTVWGLTTGESKTIDSFIVEVVSDDGKQYIHDGQVKTMDCRFETVNYRSTAGPAPNIAEPLPGVNSSEIEVCRTVHGPVVARSDDGNLARAVDYAMWLREIETVEGVLDWNRVDNMDDFFVAMSKVTWNENTMYADADGNIAFFHPGLHPWRHPSSDQRFPNVGDGSQDHCDQLVFENTPHRINPPRGYMHNWNNKPSAGWGDGVSGDASQEPSGPAGRNRNWGRVIEEELASADGLRHTDLVEMDRRIGRIDPKARAVLSAMIACDGACGLTTEEQALVDRLIIWRDNEDQQHYNDAIDIEAEAGMPGSLDTPGATIFGEVTQAMVDLITDGVVPEAFIARHERRGTHPYDAGTFHKILGKLFDPTSTSIPTTFDWFDGRSNDVFVKDALALALQRMQTEYGSTNPDDFLRIHARSPVCALANPLVGPCIDMPHQDRGSWLKLVGYVPD